MAGPRKKRKPAARPLARVGRPVLASMRNDIVMPLHLALPTMVRAEDQKAVRAARDNLAALLNIMGRVADLLRRPIDAQYLAGAHALAKMDERAARTGTLRPSGEEYRVFKAVVNHADEHFGRLNTAVLVQAIGMAARDQARLEERDRAQEQTTQAEAGDQGGMGAKDHQQAAHETA